MRKFLMTGIVALAFAVPVFAQEATPPVAPPDASAVTLTEVATGYTRPLLVTNAGDGSDRLFVVEQTGKIWIIENGVASDEIPFLDVSGIISQDALDLTGYSERGLLGLAFSPDYEENGLFFINYTDLNGNTVVARYMESEDNPNVADPSTALTILTQEQPYANHNGGHLAFGPDGYLYIAFGDGGSGGDPENRAQNLSTWLGKILRIDVSGDTYVVPEDNPFVGDANALPEIWAYGVRNPWRFTFDAETGDMYIGEVGQNQWEEVDFQPADSTGGENYGWRVYEGSHPFESGELDDTVFPIAEYSHSQGISISGGYVYRGEQLPAWNGIYFYGDFGTGIIWWLYRDEAGEWQNDILMSGTGHTISSFGEDEQHELYLVDYGGSIFRFDPAQ